MPSPAAPLRTPPSRRRRTTLVGLIGGLGVLLLALSPLRPARITGSAAGAPVELLRDGRFEGPGGSWGPAGSGFGLAPGEGRAGSQAIACAASGPRGDAGAFQSVELDRALPTPLRVTGWSRAEGVDGAPDDDYSLYVTLQFRDGSRLEKVAVPFDCGTHGWQRRELRLPAIKPVRSLVLHCLFRNHAGRVWFDDLSIEESREPEGTVLFEGAPLCPEAPRSRGVSRPRVLETRDGLRLKTQDQALPSLAVHDRESRTSGPSGFLVRDAAADGTWRPADESTLSELRLSFECRWEARRDHVAIDGELRDLSGSDRAISLAFLAPLELQDGVWADDARRSRRLEAAGEYVNVVPVPCGSTGALSRYPLGAAFDRHVGLALAADLDHPAQHRIGYHAGLRRLFLSYDFGILPDGVFLPGKARFRFVLYRFAPEDGFRGALQALYSIFPDAFARRCLDAGAWLPFTPPEQIPQWEDFGFAFYETTGEPPPSGSGALRAFRYTEPLGFWMALPPAIPRFHDQLLARLSAGDLKPSEMPLDSLRKSVMKSTAGLPQFSFRREPWCDGVVFSVNPNPRLPSATAQPPLPDGADGEFIDSAEGYAMADLDFDRDHLRHATVSPSFSIDTRVPVLFKGHAIHEYASATARELRARGKFTFGNGTPHRYSFLAPSFDILGTEVDWFPDGAFVPAGDDELLYRRALSFQKPYCILLNTRKERLTPSGLEHYFQRCLFYGMFPSLFSHDAQNDSYWKDADRIARDRPLFKKYVPLFRRTAVAGWQPVTGARTDNPSILLERFGPDALGIVYLSVLNDSANAQEATIALDLLTRRATVPERARELVTETALPIRDRKIRIAIPPRASRLLELRLSDSK